MTVLLSLIVVSIVHRGVCPDFFAFAVLKIVFPLSLVPSSILMNVNSVAIGLIVKPLALEYVAIDMPKFAMAASFVESPVALVLGAILPNLNSVSMLHVAEPLPSIRGSIFEVNFVSLFQLGLVDIIHVDIVIIVLVLIIYDDLPIAVAHVVLVLRVHVRELRSDPLSSNNSPRPCLQPNYQVNVS